MYKCREIVQGLRALPTSGAIQIRAACVTTWNHDDVGTQTVAENHVWFCDPAAARVCVDVGGTYCHQLLRRSWGLS